MNWLCHCPSIRLSVHLSICYVLLLNYTIYLCYSLVPLPEMLIYSFIQLLLPRVSSITFFHLLTPSHSIFCTLSFSYSVTFSLILSLILTHILHSFTLIPPFSISHSLVPIAELKHNSCLFISEFFLYIFLVVTLYEHNSFLFAPFFSLTSYVRSRPLGRMTDYLVWHPNLSHYQNVFNDVCEASLLAFN